MEVYNRWDRLQRLGQGGFFGPEEIGRSAVSRASRIVAQLPGVRLIPGAGMKTRVRIHRTNDCAPSVYVDGIRSGTSDEVGIDDLVPATALEMIEVYRGLAELPGELADDNARRCGAIGLWTQRGR